MEFAIFLMIMSTAMAAYSSYQQAEYSRDVGRYNKAIAKQEAEQAEREAAIAASKKRQEGQRALARQRALYGKAGVSLSSKSPLLVMEEAIAESEHDALLEEYYGASKSRSLESRGKLLSAEGEAGYSRGMWEAGGSLLEGASTYGEYKGWGTDNQNLKTRRVKYGW